MPATNAPVYPRCHSNFQGREFNSRGYTEYIGNEPADGAAADFPNPGLIRGVMLEDPPLFSSQSAPPYGPGMAQTLGPIFALWTKWLGPQFDAPHTMHDPEPELYVETLTEWIATLG